MRGQGPGADVGGGLCGGRVRPHLPGPLGHGRGEADPARPHPGSTGKDVGPSGRCVCVCVYARVCALEVVGLARVLI